MPGFELDEGAGRLAPLVVGLGDDGGGLHRGMLVERLLHLIDEMFSPAGDDDVLGAVLGWI